MTERPGKKGEKPGKREGPFDTREAVEKHERKVQARIEVRRGERRVKFH